MPSDILVTEQRLELERLSTNHPKPIMQRVAQIILLYNVGHPTREVARQIGISPSQARYWHQQFRLRGMALFPSFNEKDEEENQSLSTPSIETPVQEIEPSIGVESRDPISAAELAEMAKLQTPGVLPDDPLSEAGRKVWRFHFIQMLIHEDGTRLGENIEDLHHMRVATRRMRAAFEVFGGAFYPKALNKHLKRLRATGRALGGVRDLDVFIEKAMVYLNAQSEADQVQIRPLVENWQQERETNRLKMLAYLDSKRYQVFKKSFYTFLSTPGAGALPLAGEQNSPERVHQVVPVLVYNRLSAVRAFDPLIPNASPEQLHALRIEFKKLRYTLEYFREVLGNEVGMVIDELKDVQDHLGNLHDAQVATQILRDYLVQWDAQQNSLATELRQTPNALMAYLSAQYAERQRLMVGFKVVWEQFNRPKIRQNIALAVSVL
jgi:CHAD domain-containing protein/transposase-like protein